VFVALRDVTVEISGQRPRRVADLSLVAPGSVGAGTWVLDEPDVRPDGPETDRGGLIGQQPY
jgi:hypothetical protein